MSTCYREDVVSYCKSQKGKKEGAHNWNEYAKELADKLNGMNIHAETDCRSDKLGYLLREAQLQKVPYMLVIGDRDMENGTVSVRTRKGDDLGAMTPEEFTAKCLMEIATKSKEI